MKVFTVFFFLSAFSILFFIQKTTGRLCGKIKQNTVGARIVNGTDIGYYKYPWYALIHYDGQHHCGGALIANGVVLTAAHCIYGFSIASMTVYLGANDICVYEDPNRAAYDIRDTDVHYKYLTHDPYYDIALIYLEGNTAKYEPVCLPLEPQNDLNRATVGWVQGLGVRYPDDPYDLPCVLQEAALIVFKEKACKQMLRREGGRMISYLMEHVFCAGYLKGQIDTCQGDSGGPMVALRTDAEGDYYELIGLVSFGFDCAKAGALGIYTDPSHFYDWLGIVGEKR